MQSTQGADRATQPGPPSIAGGDERPSGTALALLQLLHYGCVGLPLERWCAGAARLHSHPRAVLEDLLTAGLPPEAQRAALEELRARGWIDGRSDGRWQLSRLGYYVSYNLCEYHIQRGGGFWHYLRDTVAPPESGTVVDVGAAGGVGLALAAELGLFPRASLLALDLSVDSMQAGRLVRGWVAAGDMPVSCCAADAASLPIASASVETFLSKGTLHYVDGPVFVAELRRVLKVGGTFALSVPSWRNMWAKLKRSLEERRPLRSLKFLLAMYNAGAEGWATGAQIHLGGRTVRGSTPTGLRRLFAQPGLTLEDIRYGPSPHEASRPIFLSGRRTA